jgi:hypothetical protein
VLQRVRPEHTSEYLNNPHTGTTTFQRFNGDPLQPDLFDGTCSLARPWVAPDGAEAMEAEGVQDWDRPFHADLHNDRFPPTRIAYVRWAWRLLEPRKGEVRFDLIDRALATAAARRQTLQLRTQPFIGPMCYECPEWYWQTGAAIDPATAGSKYRTPDHNDGRYLEHWGGHIQAMGRRYDGHPNLESFDLSYGGGCGEGGGNCTPETAHRLAQIYLDSFRGTPLLGQLGTEGCKYAARQQGWSVGWRADCFGDIHSEGGGAVPDGLCWNHMNDMYPQEIVRCGMTDAWKSAPVTFETGWGVAHWFRMGWDIDWILDQGLKYHASVFQPKSMVIPEPWMDKVMAFCQRLGYWLHLQQIILPLEARPGGTCNVAAVIDNKGVAPLYRPYRFALRFSQGPTHKVVRLREDVRTWMPDLSYFAESFVFPPGLSRGEAKVSCAIVDAQDKPVVRFAIKTIGDDGWHPLTSIDVV